MCLVLVAELKIFSCITRDLVLQPKTELGPSALRARRLSHWTTTEVPKLSFIWSFYVGSAGKTLLVTWGQRPELSQRESQVVMWKKDFWGRRNSKRPRQAHMWQVLGMARRSWDWNKSQERHHEPTKRVSIVHRSWTTAPHLFSWLFWG